MLMLQQHEILTRKTKTEKRQLPIQLDLVLTFHYDR